MVPEVERMTLRRNGICFGGQLGQGRVEIFARVRAAALGGSVIVLDAPRGLRTEIDIWGPIPALAVMRRVKEQFDPDHRLAPGRFVGGI